MKNLIIITLLLGLSANLYAQSCQPGELAGKVSGTNAITIFMTGKEGDNNHTYDFGFAPEVERVLNLAAQQVTVDSNGLALLLAAQSAVRTRRRGASAVTQHSVLSFTLRT